MPGQWEYQVGPCVGILGGDHVWMSRWDANISVLYFLRQFQLFCLSSSLFLSSHSYLLATLSFLISPHLSAYYPFPFFLFIISSDTSLTEYARISVSWPQSTQSQSPRVTGTALVCTSTSQQKRWECQRRMARVDSRASSRLLIDWVPDTLNTLPFTVSSIDQNSIIITILFYTFLFLFAVENSFLFNIFYFCDFAIRETK